jgi:hypothetical protein
VREVLTETREGWRIVHPGFVRLAVLRRARILPRANPTNETLHCLLEASHDGTEPGAHRMHTVRNSGCDPLEARQRPGDQSLLAGIGPPATAVPTRDQHGVHEGTLRHLPHGGCDLCTRRPDRRTAKSCTHPSPPGPFIKPQHRLPGSAIGA